MGLWVTKFLRVLDPGIWTGRVRELQEIRETENGLEIGAAVTYTDAMPQIAALYPDMGELFRRLGAEQVRNVGTIGGNIANGSPIGDMPPALIALGSRIELRRGRQVRSMPIEEFYIEYGKQKRDPGELVTRITIPHLEAGHIFRCFKVSKRFDQDISSVMGAFRFTVNGDGAIVEARCAYGGMAGVPKRATGAEVALVGQQLRDSRAWAQAFASLRDDFKPLDDHRASAKYRAETAHALLGKALIEAAGTVSSRTRVTGFREVEAHAAG